MGFEVGDILEGRYRLLVPLGHGGLADVWEAESLHGTGKVALKILREGRGAGTELARRMRREAEAMAAIQSRHICALLDSGLFEDHPYLVFERLYGETLQDLLERQRYLPLEEASNIMTGILEGLAEAHRAQVVHRDLSPANVHLEPLESGYFVRLLDFGIAKYSACDSTLTRKGGLLGSLGYIAPEQVLAASEADARADIYSAATIVFRCLSGVLPFFDPSPQVVLSMKTQLDPPTLEQVVGGHWPSGLERFLCKALARRPEDRFASALAALAAWRVVVAEARAGVESYGLLTSEEETREDTPTAPLAVPPSKTKGTQPGKRR